MIRVFLFSFLTNCRHVGNYQGIHLIAKRAISFGLAISCNIKILMKYQMKLQTTYRKASFFAQNGCFLVLFNKYLSNSYNKTTTGLNHTNYLILLPKHYKSYISHSKIAVCLYFEKSKVHL